MGLIIKPTCKAMLVLLARNRILRFIVLANKMHVANFNYRILFLMS